MSTWQHPLRKTTGKLQIWFNVVFALWWELPAIAMVHLGRAGREGEDQTQTLQGLSCKAMKVRIPVLSTPSSIPSPTYSLRMSVALPYI